MRSHFPLFTYQNWDIQYTGTFVVVLAQIQNASGRIDRVSHDFCLKQNIMSDKVIVA